MKCRTTGKREMFNKNNFSLLRVVVLLLREFTRNQRIIMSALEDVQAAVEGLKGEVSSAADEIAKLAAAIVSANGNEAALADVAKAITAESDALHKAVADAEAAVNPPAPPAG